MRSKTGGCGRLVRSERQRRICLLRYVQRLKELYEQALNDIQKKDEQAEECRHQLQETTENLRSQEKAAHEAQLNVGSWKKPVKGLMQRRLAQGRTVSWSTCGL